MTIGGVKWNHRHKTGLPAPTQELTCSGDFMQPVTKINEITEAELLQRARALIPVLQERAAKADKERVLPRETIADLQAADLFKILQPKRYGGFEMNPRVFYEVQMALAEGCMST